MRGLLFALALALASTAAVGCHPPPGTLTVTTPLESLRAYPSCRVFIDATAVEDAEKAVGGFAAYVTEKLSERKTCHVPPRDGEPFIVLHIKVIELEKTSHAIVGGEFRTTLAVTVLDGATDERLAELVASGNSKSLLERQYGHHHVEASQKRLSALRNAGDEIIRYLATRA